MSQPEETNLFSGEAGLTTARFDLKPMRYDDAPDLPDHFSDPEVVEFMDIDPLESLEDARGIVRWAQGVREFGEGLRWVIREKATGAFIGTAGFNTLEVDRGRRGEIAYDLSRDFWGKGVMSEILPVLMRTGYGTLGLHRLEAFVTPGNTRSVRLLERHGFVIEGTLKDYGYWKGRFWDQLVFGRIED